MEDLQKIILASRIAKDAGFAEYVKGVDYLEQPVSITQFIEDPEYLGLATDKGRKLYDCWRTSLQEVFSDDIRFEIVLTGSIGIGKSACADIGLAYILYNTLILKDPHSYYGLLTGKPLTIVFFSMTTSLASSNNFGSFQQKIQVSPWFRQRGFFTGSAYPLLKFTGIDYKLASPRASGGGMVGGDVIGGVLDEINTPNEAVSVKRRAFSAYQSCVQRMKSRFMERGKLPGMKLFLCASKDDELSFIDTHIASRKNSSEMLVKDIKLWEAKPGRYSGKTFPVAIGDAFKKSCVIDPIQKDEFLVKGYKIIDVPIEHRTEFDEDVVMALRDVAGETITGDKKYRLFSSDKFIVRALRKELRDPVQKGTIITGLTNPTEYIDYVDLDMLEVPLQVERHLHLDISITGDCSSLGCSCIKAWTTRERETDDGTFKEVAMPLIHTDFALRFRAAEGDRIPLNKVRRFIFELKRLGMNIKMFTSDLLLASEDTRQILQQGGIDCAYLSVDRTPKAYLDFRNIVFEDRWSTPHNDILFYELKYLELVQRESGSIKVDHPEFIEKVVRLNDGDVKVMKAEGSKDVADGVVGSVYGILKDVKPGIDVDEYVALVDGVSQQEVEPQGWFEAAVSGGASVKKKGAPVKVAVDPTQQLLDDMSKDLDFM